MFVGHYAASLAIKSIEKKANLGLLFIAVQFVDILFFPLVLAGVERLRVVENFTASTHFDLVYMPYTHSLVAAFVWAALAYAVFVAIRPMKGGGVNTAAAAVSIGVLSHWFFDLVVHTPDLPLVTDDGPKVGLGLWNHAGATYALEAVLLVAALVMYLRATTGEGYLGRYGMVGFVVLLLFVNVANIFGPPFGGSTASLAVSALVFYFLFAGIAYWLDKKRS